MDPSRVGTGAVPRRLPLAVSAVSRLSRKVLQSRSFPRPEQSKRENTRPSIKDGAPRLSAGASFADDSLIRRLDPQGRVRFVRRIQRVARKMRGAETEKEDSACAT